VLILATRIIIKIEKVVGKWLGHESDVGHGIVPGHDGTARQGGVELAAI